MGKIVLAARIISDRAIHSGKPIIEGTRVPVDLVLGKLAMGMTYEEVSKEYAIAKKDILAVLKYAQRLAEGQGRSDQ